MRKNVLNIIKPYKTQTIILSVSGGIDSLVLFDMLHKNNYNIVVVHFNHLTRNQAYEEAKHVRSLCNSLGVRNYYFELQIDDKENFHHKAHNLRKKHLKEIAKKYNTNLIVTAHHLNDLAESVLLKLSRGSNLLGYAGMNEIHKKDGFIYIKPLLLTPKEELIKYAQQNNIFYYEDESNLEDDYQRNKIRHHVIPYLIEDSPQFLNKVIQYQNTLKETFKYIRNEAIKFLNGKDYFMVSKFLNLNEVIKKEVISYLLENNNLNPSLNKINSIISFLEKSGPNDSFDLGNNMILLKTYNKANITFKEDKIEFKKLLNFDDINVLPEGTIINFNNTLAETLNNEVVLCYNELVLPLWARTRQPGDLLYFPYGHKKLKDFFIDKKIPKEIRDKSIIITDNNDQILAVLGLYINSNPKLENKILLKYRRNH